jgi:hypothetical protein
VLILALYPNLFNVSYNQKKENHIQRYDSTSLQPIYR